jgi:hypothetical protein
MHWFGYRFGIIGLLAVFGLLAAPAFAGPDAEGTVIITSATCEDLGAPCSGPLYSVTKAFEVYAADNADNPDPIPGNFTYVYTLTNSPTSVTLFGDVNLFKTVVPKNGVTSAGFIDGAGVEPSSIVTAAGVTNDEVRWHFDAPYLTPGDTSEKLTLHSPYGPGQVTDTVISIGNTFSVDTNNTCVGPVVAPPPLACTIGFWKNREAGKQGLLKFFEGADFDAVKAKAVAISSVFSTEAELVAALTSKGNRSIDERAKQQDAALSLNIAAGILFPSNTKCRLFLGANGTQLDLDGNGVADTTLEAAYTDIESWINSLDPALQGDAKDLADDINNGVGVINATMFN